MYKQAPKDDDYDYIVGLDAKQAPTRSRQEAEEGNVLPSLPSERQKKKKKLIRKRRKQTSDENVGDDILNSADELLNKEEMSQVSAIDLLLKQKMTVNEGESDPAKEQIQKPKRRIKQRSENKEAKSCGDAPTFEGKFRKKSIPPNDKEAATIQPRPRVSHPKVVLPAVVERKTLVAGGCPRCSAEENCSKHTSLTRIQRKSIPKDLKKAQKQGEDSPPPKNTNSRENPTKIENHEHQKPEDLEYVRSLVEEVRRLDPEERTKVLQVRRSIYTSVPEYKKEHIVGQFISLSPLATYAYAFFFLQAVRGGSEDFLLKEDNKHARKVTKDSISSEEVLSGSEDGEQGRKGRIYLHDGSYVSTTQSKDSPQTPTLQTVEQEDKDLCEDEANYSDEDFLAEPQEEERVNLATDHYHSDFED